MALPAEAIDAAMVRSDYPLQALLYPAALHRYLRWRLPGYAPSDTSARSSTCSYGACGPRRAEVDGYPCGVFTWRPPVPLVEELSHLLAGRVVTS